MTTANIRIIREVLVSSIPAPGTTARLVAITYAFGPTSPKVIIVPESELADRVWQLENPGVTPIPPEVVAQGDADRRRLILERLGQSPADEGRVI